MIGNNDNTHAKESIHDRTGALLTELGRIEHNLRVVDAILNEMEHSFFHGATHAPVSEQDFYGLRSVVDMLKQRGGRSFCRSAFGPIGAAVGTGKMPNNQDRHTLSAHQYIVMQFTVA